MRFMLTMFEPLYRGAEDSLVSAHSRHAIAPLEDELSDVICGNDFRCVVQIFGCSGCIYESWPILGNPPQNYFT